MKRILIGSSIAIIILILMSFSSVVAIDTPISSGKGEILYVGGTGEGNYTTIQEAIDDANPGDTVFVYSGEYNQEPTSQTLVRMYKSIFLIGEDKNTTILNGNGDRSVTGVTADGAVFNGFTIQNSGSLGSGMFVSSCRNVRITNNIFINNPNCGIYSTENTNTSFYNNIFINSDCAFYISSAIDCSIYRNYFNDNNRAIQTFEQEELLIESNEFNQNKIGISISYSKDLKIQFNNFISNQRHAKFIRQGGIGDFQDLLDDTQYWNGNYWNRWLIIDSKPILGQIIIWLPTGIPLLNIPIRFPALEFDKNPAQEPNDIEV